MFGSEIREARLALGLTRTGLARLAGVPPKQVTSLESGGNVMLSTLMKIVAKLPNLKSIDIGGFTLETGHDLTPLHEKLTTMYEISKSLYERYVPPPPPPPKEEPAGASRVSPLATVDPKVVAELEDFIGRLLRGDEAAMKEVTPFERPPRKPSKP